jgi:hypothetical protein
MRVTIVRNTVAARRVVEVGAILTLDDAEGRLLVSLGKAVETSAAPRVVAPALTVQTQPAPGRRRR